MIDTHCHVIPYCDDGAENWDVALQMLRDAAQDGITQVVCTPHVLSGKDLLKEPEFYKLYNELVEKTTEQQIPIQLHMGSELYIQPDFDFSKKMATLAQNDRYFLMEFPMSSIPPFVAKRFFETLPAGKTAIIAHPERNGTIIRDPEFALQLVEKGAILQVTGGSLLGRFGSTVQQIAQLLLDANAAHIIASDGHDPVNRPLKLQKAYEYVVENWGVERATLLFNANPQRILNGEDLPPLEIDVSAFQPKKKKGMFSFFK